MHDAKPVSIFGCGDPNLRDGAVSHHLTSGKPGTIGGRDDFVTPPSLVADPSGPVGQRNLATRPQW